MQTFTEDDSKFITKDKTIILLMLYNKLDILYSGKDPQSPNSTKFVFPRTKAEEIIENFKMHKYPEFEKFIQALSLFNTLIHQQ